MYAIASDHAPRGCPNLWTARIKYGFHKRLILIFFVGQPPHLVEISRGTDSPGRRWACWAARLQRPHVALRIGGSCEYRNHILHASDRLHRRCSWKQAEAVAGRGILLTQGVPATLWGEFGTGVGGSCSQAWAWRPRSLSPWCQQQRDIDWRRAALDASPQLGDGTTWILAIMPPSSCSRMWQW